MQEIVQAITILFECLKQENKYMNSDLKDLREESYDLTSDIKINISTLQKNVYSLNLEIDINQYEYGDDLVISGDIIPHGTPTENCKDILLKLIWHHLNMNLCEDELIISHRIGEKPINGVDNRKYFFQN